MLLGPVLPSHASTLRTLVTTNRLKAEPRRLVRLLHAVDVRPVNQQMGRDTEALLAKAPYR